MKYYFFSGFEINGVGNFTSATGAVQAVVKKKGPYAGDVEDNENFLKTLATGQSTIYQSGWFRWSVNIVNNWYVMLGGGANGQFEVKTYSTNHLKVTVDGNSTTYTETTTNLVKDTWYFIEIKFVMHDSTGSFELRVDGDTVLSQTGIDTKNIDASMTTFKWQGINGAGNCYVDNCALSDNWAYDYGLIVTKTGISADEASVHQTKFGSNYNTLKILSGTYKSITTNGAGAGSGTVAHNLSYKPAFLVFGYKATSDTLDGISYSNCNFIAGSAHFTSFYYDSAGTNPSLRDVVCDSDTGNINISISGPAATNYKLYIYILDDLAEETAQAKSFNGTDYGLRISQKDYDAKTDPDYRMIYSSKDKSFHIAKTGSLSLSIPQITLNDGQEDLVKTEATFSSLGISAGYHPYLLMISDMDISMASPAYFWVDGGYVPWLPYSGLPEKVSHTGAFCTNDRIVLYGWRSYENLGSGNSFTFGATTVYCRYMIFNETFTFS